MTPGDTFGGQAVLRRVIITGTREELSAEDRAIATDLILRAAAWADEVGVGDCPTGIDALVRELVPGARVFRADWQAFGRKAGPMRNGDLVGWGAEADECWALGFPGPRSKGSWDCVRQAKAAEVDVLVRRVGGAR